MKYSNSLYLKDQIPKWKTWNNEPFHPISYSELLLPPKAKIFFESNNLEVTTYRDLLEQILPNGKIKQNGETYKKEQDWICHFDPDLESSTLARSTNWRGLFGQADKAELHLRNNQLGKDDLFLFFGWFRKTILKDNQLIYDPLNKEDMHIIYGYLQVDYKLTKNDSEKVQSWMNYHPHFRYELWNEEHNSVYVARKNLSWNNNKPGAGTFQFSSELILTDLTNNNPKGLRTHWRYDLFPMNLYISYHKPKSHCIEINDQGNKIKYFQAATRGQEFVITDSSKIIGWVKSLFA